VAVLSARGPRFPLLDSVRAVAALSVLVFHAGYLSGLTRTPGVLAGFVSRLDVGVAVFFVLSGFLLYRPFVRARLLGGGAPGVRAYLWRRALRILPAYWLALTCIALVLDKDEVLAHPLTYYGLLQIYDHGRELTGIPQAWTLCVEVSFYAFLPAWALAVRRLLPATARAELAALALLAAAGLAYQAALLAGAADPQHANTPGPLLWLPAFLDHFALGMALAVLSVAGERDGAAPRAVRWVEARPWAAWAGAVVAFALVAHGIGLDPVNTFDAPTTAGEALAKHVLYAVVAVGVLLPAAFGAPDRGWIRRLLGARALLALGTVSYGIYLFHNGVLELLARPSALGGAAAPLTPALVVVGALASAAIAAVSWRALERPALTLRRLVPDRRDRGRSASSPAPAPAPSARRP
jgi:peptidoglycan/LPS O-acetylase OafA/YrhL